MLGIDAIITPNCPHLLFSSPEFRLRVPYRIFKVQGDGKLSFVQAVQTLDAAKACIEELARSWPGEYVIHNEETREWASIIAGSTKEN